MTKETILETDKMGLWFYPDEKIVHHKIKKFIFGETFEKLLSTGADVFLEKGCNKWLSDDSSNSAVRQEDLDWGDKNWTPRVVQGGWKYWALVMPEKVLAKRPMQGLIDYYAGIGVSVQVFTNADEALQWLASQK